MDCRAQTRKRHFFRVFAVNRRKIDASCQFILPGRDITLIYVYTKFEKDTIDNGGCRAQTRNVCGPGGPGPGPGAGAGGGGGPPLNP